MRRPPAPCAFKLSLAMVLRLGHVQYWSRAQAEALAASAVAEARAPPPFVPAAASSMLSGEFAGSSGALNKSKRWPTMYNTYTYTLALTEQPAPIYAFPESSDFQQSQNPSYVPRSAACARPLPHCHWQPCTAPPAPDAYRAPTAARVAAAVARHVAACA